MHARQAFRNTDPFDCQKSSQLCALYIQKHYNSTSSSYKSSQSQVVIQKILLYRTNFIQQILTATVKARNQTAKQTLTRSEILQQILFRSALAKVFDRFCFSLWEQRVLPKTSNRDCENQKQKTIDATFKLQRGVRLCSGLKLSLHSRVYPLHGVPDGINQVTANAKIRCVFDNSFLTDGRLEYSLQKYTKLSGQNTPFSLIIQYIFSCIERTVGIVTYFHVCQNQTYIERRRVFLGPKWSKNVPEIIPVALNEITPAIKTKFSRLSCSTQSLSCTMFSVKFPSCSALHKSQKKYSCFSTTTRAAQPQTIAENSNISKKLQIKTAQRSL